MNPAVDITRIRTVEMIRIQTDARQRLSINNLSRELLRLPDSKTGGVVPPFPQRDTGREFKGTETCVLAMTGLWNSPDDRLRMFENCLDHYLLTNTPAETGINFFFCICVLLTFLCISCCIYCNNDKLIVKRSVPVLVCIR